MLDARLFWEQLTKLGTQWSQEVQLDGTGLRKRMRLCFEGTDFALLERQDASPAELDRQTG